MRRTALALAASAVVATSLPGVLARAQTPTRRPVVYEVAQTGTVDPLSAHHTQRGLRIADAADAAAVLVRIDTPGGLDSSMREIIKSVLASPVPVVCWVGPPGARAASAGAFILTGCPVAAMAPGTNVGAAHPVGFSGEVMAEKITNDAAAYIRSLAERWGRNPDWAEKAVRDSVSVSAQEALKLHAIDVIAPTRASLFASLEGRSIRTAAGDVTVHLAGASVVVVRPTIGESLLHGLVDPNIAFLFFVFGIAGIVFEVLHPGINIPGVIGIVLLITSFVILGMLPVNIGGLILIAAAIVFFIIDLKVAGHGVPTAAGIISLVFGGLFLFDAAIPNARVSRALIVGVALAIAGFFSFALRAALRARHEPVTAGPERLVGTEGVVERDLDPAGLVRAGGESWSATSARGSIVAGSAVRVTAVRGVSLEVELLGGDAGQSARHEGTEVS
ncbi:MAG: nodulation protein NfeD [Actinomycetota bacterium]|nr:nodulation protein NfeD [Actinomycetota bacterium]